MKARPKPVRRSNNRNICERAGRRTGRGLAEGAAAGAWRRRPRKLDRWRRRESACMWGYRISVEEKVRVGGRVAKFSQWRPATFLLDGKKEGRASLFVLY
jgi:hypothetical protein